MMAFRFLMERLEWFLRRENDIAFCIYDQNKRLEGQLQNKMSTLITDGSPIQYFSEYFGTIVNYTWEIKQVFELAFGNSHNSIGLQISDYFATMSYQYFKKNLSQAFAVFYIYPAIH